MPTSATSVGSAGAATTVTTAGGRNNANKGLVMDLTESSWVATLIPGCETPRFPYSRPEFLYLISEDEIAVSGDQATRPVLVPKDPLRMPLYAGYAESINAGKTEQNEDQGVARTLAVSTRIAGSSEQGRSGRAMVASDSNSIGGRLGSVSSVDEVIPELLHGAEVTSPKSPAAAVKPDLDDKMLNAQEKVSDEQGDCFHDVAVYFGIFDGHAGTGAAQMAANCLHEHIRQRLSKVLETIYQVDKQEELLGVSIDKSIDSKTRPDRRIFERADSSISGDVSLAPDLAIMTLGGKVISRDALVCGALETSFVEMDEQIQNEKMFWRIPGGCAAIVALFFMRRLYIANAGDCRAVVCCRGQVEQLSADFTPESERKRLQQIASIHPEYLGKHYSRLEYSRRLTKKDLGTRVLYRDWYMDGWAHKTVKAADLREPLISDGPGKARLLSTIGVTRGFGDHHLVTVDHSIFIKPFLTPVPELHVFNLKKYADDSDSPLSDRDVLILASDGLWDVMENEEAANIVNATLSQYPEDDVTKYTLAAQDLVVWARGQPGRNGHGWQATREGGVASCDDITVFVVPLKVALSPPPPDDDEELLQ